MAVFYFQMNRVLHIAAVRQDDDVARHDDYAPVRAALIGEGVNQAYAPMVKVARLVGKAILAHHRVFAPAVAQVGTGFAGDMHLLGFFIHLVGIHDGVFKPRRGLQIEQVVRRINHHLHTYAVVHHLFQPSGEQGNMEDQNHVGDHQRL